MSGMQFVSIFHHRLCSSMSVCCCFVCDVVINGYEAIAIIVNVVSVVDDNMTGQYCGR